jgi:hypothetical protein
MPVRPFCINGGVSRPLLQARKARPLDESRIKTGRESGKMAQSAGVHWFWAGCRAALPAGPFYPHIAATRTEPMIRFAFKGPKGPRIVTIPRWAQGLAVILATFAGMALLVLGAGLALIAIPALIAFGLFARWRLKKTMAQMQAEADRPPPGVIDAEYRVIDDRR